MTPAINESMFGPRLSRVQCTHCPMSMPSVHFANHLASHFRFGLRMRAFKALNDGMGEGDELRFYLRRARTGRCLKLLCQFVNLFAPFVLRDGVPSLARVYDERLDYELTVIERVMSSADVPLTDEEIDDVLSVRPPTGLVGLNTWTN